MLTHDGYNFGGSSLHGDIVNVGDFEPQIVREQWFGVDGEAHLLGAAGGRDLQCDYFLTGFTQAALGNQLADIDNQINVLQGTLSISGNISGSYPKCTFVGFERGPQFVDGSGVNGWCCRLMLHWRQRARQ